MSEAGRNGVRNGVRKPRAAAQRGLDPFGFDPVARERAKPFFRFLYKYYWRVEVLELLPGPAFGFDEVAMATAPVKWIARWRLRRAKRRLRAQAVTASKEPTK